MMTNEQTISLMAAILYGSGRSANPEDAVYLASEILDAVCVRWRGAKDVAPPLPVVASDFMYPPHHRETLPEKETK